MKIEVSLILDSDVDYDYMRRLSILLDAPREIFDPSKLPTPNFEAKKRKPKDVKALPEGAGVTTGPVNLAEALDVATAIGEGEAVSPEVVEQAMKVVLASRPPLDDLSDEEMREEIKRLVFEHTAEWLRAVLLHFKVKNLSALTREQAIPTIRDGWAKEDAKNMGNIVRLGEFTSD